LGQAPLAEPAAAAAPPPRPIGGATERLGLRITELSPALAAQFGFVRNGGAVVEEVLEFSPADRKRVGSGHRLVMIDRQPVASARDARTLLRNARSGQVVSLMLETPEGRTYIANVRMP
jgi:S1-C subfamily serine protease